MKSLLEKKCTSPADKKAVEGELKNSRAIDVLREVLIDLESNCIKPTELDSYEIANWERLVADRFGQARAYKKVLSILEIK